MYKEHGGAGFGPDGRSQPRWIHQYSSEVVEVGNFSYQRELPWSTKGHRQKLARIWGHAIARGWATLLLRARRSVQPWTAIITYMATQESVPNVCGFLA
jgi:hypothetical protein